MLQQHNKTALELINQFRHNQNLTSLQMLKNAGIGTKILKDNRWEYVSELRLPLNRFVPLYEMQNGFFKITDIGIY